MKVNLEVLLEEQFLLTATVQNIKKMAKLLHRGNKEAREAIQGMVNLSNYAIKWFRVIIDLPKNSSRTSLTKVLSFSWSNDNVFFIIHLPLSSIFYYSN